MSSAIDTKNNGTGAIANAEPTLAQRYGLTESQLELVRTQIAPGAPDDVLELYFSRCKQLAFDPLSKMLFAIPRGGWKKDAAGNFITMNGKRVWDERQSWTFQTSIDGFRSIAEGSQGYAGQVGPYWCGQDGVWVDVWLKKETPAAAKVGVLREGFKEPLYAVATFEEYAQRSKDGALTGLWPKMPAIMIAKCAEALALRKAFPQRLAGVYAREEMDQAANGTDAAALPADAAPKKPRASKAQTALPAAAENFSDEAMQGQRPTNPPPPQGDIEAEMIEPPTEAEIMERYKALTQHDANAPKIGVWLKTAKVCDLTQKQKVNGKYILTDEERRKADVALDALEVRVRAQQPAEPVEEATIVEEPAAPTEAAPTDAGSLFDNAAPGATGDPSINEPCDTCEAKPGQPCKIWCDRVELDPWPEQGYAEQAEGDSTRAQRARIGIMSGEADLSDEHRHRLIHYYYEPKWSAKHLSKAEASEFIDLLKNYQEWLKAEG